MEFPGLNVPMMLENLFHLVFLNVTPGFWDGKSFLNKGRKLKQKLVRWRLRTNYPVWVWWVRLVIE